MKWKVCKRFRTFKRSTHLSWCICKRSTDGISCHSFWDWISFCKVIKWIIVERRYHNSSRISNSNRCLHRQPLMPTMTIIWIEWPEVIVVLQVIFFNFVEYSSLTAAFPSKQCLTLRTDGKEFCRKKAAIPMWSHIRTRYFWVVSHWMRTNKCWLILSVISVRLREFVHPLHLATFPQAIDKIFQRRVASKGTKRLCLFDFWNWSSRSNVVECLHRTRRQFVQRSQVLLQNPRKISENPQGKMRDASLLIVEHSWHSVTSHFSDRSNSVGNWWL